MKMKFKYNFLVIFSIIIFFIFFNVDKLNIQLYSKGIITKNVSEMLPSLISDPKIEESDNNHVKISYLFYFGFDAMELKCEIYKFPTIEDAIGNYSSIGMQYSDQNIIKIGLGDEGFGIEKKYASIAVFRKINVVVKTELDGKYSSLDQAINYAKKVKV